MRGVGDGWAVADGGFLLLQWAAGALQGAATAALGDRIDTVLQRDLMDAVMRDLVLEGGAGGPDAQVFGNFELSVTER